MHLLFASANRDPREFGPDAGNLDVTRTITRALAFSSGPHHCLGAAAARLEGRVVIEELLRAMPDFVADTAAARYAPGPVHPSIRVPAHPDRELIDVRGIGETSGVAVRYAGGGGRPIERATRCPERTALSMYPASVSVCSPANHIRPWGARRTGQNGTNWPGANTAYPPPV